MANLYDWEKQKNIWIIIPTDLEKYSFIWDQEQRDREERRRRWENELVIEQEE